MQNLKIKLSYFFLMLIFILWYGFQTKNLAQNQLLTLSFSDMLVTPPILFSNVMNIISSVLSFLGNLSAVSITLTLLIVFIAWSIRKLEVGPFELVGNLIFLTGLLFNPISMKYFKERPASVFIIIVLAIFFKNMMTSFKVNIPRLFISYGMVTSLLMFLGKSGVVLSLTILALFPIIFSFTSQKYKFKYLFPLIFFPALAAVSSLGYIAFLKGLLFKNIIFEYRAVVVLNAIWLILTVFLILLIALNRIRDWEHHVVLIGLLLLPFLYFFIFESNLNYALEIGGLISISWGISLISLYRIKAHELGILIAYLLVLFTR